jgi:uncharacterized membrane protein
VLGLVLFLGIHLIPVLSGTRSHLFESFGEKRYKGMFSIFSALGLALIVIGYSRSPTGPRLFDPLPGAIAIAPLAMVISFVLLAAANMRTHLRHAVRHPMLLGVGIWALVHLLANGHAKATLLFGAFLAYTVIDIISASARHAVKPFKPNLKQDAIAVVAGIFLAILVMIFHRQLFGVTTVSWGM